MSTESILAEILTKWTILGFLPKLVVVGGLGSGNWPKSQKRANWALNVVKHTQSAVHTILKRHVGSTEGILIEIFIEMDKFRILPKIRPWTVLISYI